MTGARIVAASAATIAEAARILRAGGVVGFPTETVYGLGADATNDAAVARIFSIKGRPAFNPLIVHVAEPGWIDALAEPSAHLDVLARAFWPGPLTLVLRQRRESKISAAATAGGKTIAIRCPDGATAQALLKDAARPLAAPSANRSAGVSATTAEHVGASLGGDVDLILDAGPCRVGLKSTVLDLTSAIPTILRPGSITAAQIAQVLGTVAEGTDDPSAPKSPGQLLRHYAPTLPLRLGARRAEPGEALLGFGPMESATLNLSPQGDLDEAARHLFAMIRALDDPARFTGIAVAEIPRIGVGVAINDRLTRATHTGKP